MAEGEAFVFDDPVLLRATSKRRWPNPDPCAGLACGIAGRSLRPVQPEGVMKAASQQTKRINPFPTVKV